MFMHRIKLQNILSFGPDAQELELEPLNVLIGPNGSGKSNFIDAIGLLQATPTDLAVSVRERGGVQDWVWQDEAAFLPTACIEAIVQVLTVTYKSLLLRHRLEFADMDYRLQVFEERIESAESLPDFAKPRLHFALGPDGRAVLADYQGENDQRRPELKERELRSESLDRQQSVLAQRKDLERYPELFSLGEMYRRIRMYRDWHFGRQTPVRLPQKPDLPNDNLMEDCRNLGLVLNRLSRDIDAKERLLGALKGIYEGVSDFHVNIEYGAVQVFLREDKSLVPATRLSDGTLRYLCLLTILCHPRPPPLVCIEEPELGLHPDIIPGLAELLREASQRCQLIVTTHSDILVDALSDTPESVVVCEKENGQTTMKRLDKQDLAGWLERYSLGDYWMRGGLGGTRW